MVFTDELEERLNQIGRNVEILRKAIEITANKDINEIVEDTNGKTRRIKPKVSEE